MHSHGFVLLCYNPHKYLCPQKRFGSKHLLAYMQNEVGRCAHMLTYAHVLKLQTTLVYRDSISLSLPVLTHSHSMSHGSEDAKGCVWLCELLGWYKNLTIIANLKYFFFFVEIWVYDIKFNPEMKWAGKKMHISFKGLYIHRCVAERNWINNGIFIKTETFSELSWSQCYWPYLFIYNKLKLRFRPKCWFVS